MKPCCRYPFERVSICDDGSVSFCSPDYNHRYFIGNIFEQEFKDIWFGEKAQKFRKSVLNNSYKYCDLKTCSNYSDDNCAEFTESDVIKPKYPRIVDLNYLKSCDVRCLTCRDKLEMETNVKTSYYNDVIDDVVDLCRNARVVYLNGSGEVFASNHLKLVISTLVKNYPNLNFILHTNGLLCDEKHLKDFGLLDNIYEIFVSVPAATKKTYEKIVRGGYWKQLQKNLKYLSNLKKEGRFSSFNMVFLFHSLNYKEMPKFVKMANKLGVPVLFCKFRNWGDVSDMCRNYEKYTCWATKHKDYKKFLKVLHKLKKMSGYKFEESFFYDLMKQKPLPLVRKLKNKIVGGKK